MKMSDFKTMIIGVDHGYNNIKTANTIFPTTLTTLEALPDNKSGILQFNGKIYSEYGERIPYVNSSDKTSTMDFYILTLIAIAKELKLKGLNGACVKLAAGLPQRWFEKQKESFQKYLMKYPEVNFKYEGKTYHVFFLDCMIFTQGFAALMSSSISDDLFDRTIEVVDIGGGTVDFIPVKQGHIDFVNSKIDQKASNWLLNELNENVETELSEVLPMDYAINYIINGSKDKTPENEYQEIMQRELINYCEMIFTRLKEFKINTALTKVVFVGGGATIIKNFGTFNDKTTEFILDLKANAIGYQEVYSLLSNS